MIYITYYYCYCCYYLMSLRWQLLLYINDYKPNIIKQSAKKRDFEEVNLINQAISKQ